MPTKTRHKHKQGNYEILDRNVTTDYVTLIVDVWEGDRNDPAVQVERYIGVWRIEDLDDGASDPNFSEVDTTHSRYRYSHDDGGVKPAPLAWTVIETTKEADKQARSAKKEAMDWEDPESYVGWGENRKKELYIAFLDAIDTLAEDPTNEQALAAVDAFRSHSALKHEK
jgi:hypothetical protein